MKTKRLYTWQFFVGAFIGLILGAVLGTLLLMKNIDVAGIKEDHEYLKKQYEMLRQREIISNSMSDYIDDARSMIDYNEQAIVEPEEEGK